MLILWEANAFLPAVFPTRVLLVDSYTGSLHAPVFFVGVLEFLATFRDIPSEASDVFLGPE